MSSGLFSNCVAAYFSVFVLSLACSYILKKSENLSNRVASTLNSANSLFGAAFSFIFLFSGMERQTIAAVTTNIPLISFTISFDSVSAFFFLILNILTFMTSIYSIGYMGHYIGKKSIALFNTLNTLFIMSMALVFTSSNLIFFFIVWEIMSVVSFFLVAFDHEDPDARSSSVLYLVMTHIGAAFILLAFLMIYAQTGTLSMDALMSARIESKAVITLLLLIGFGMKAGLVPLHIWLPYAHPAAPSNVSALMSGIMLKTAFYGILRFIFQIVGIDSPYIGLGIVSIGIVTVVFGASYMYMESNLKRLLAYSSIENVGIISIGVGVAALAMTYGAQSLFMLALAGACFHMFAHALFKCVMFLSAGSIHMATHTKNLNEMGGLIKLMPVTAVFLLAGSLSMAAIVPFGGFPGEWLTFQSIFAMIQPSDAPIRIVLILAAASIALAGAFACASVVKLIGVSFLGRSRSEGASHAEEVPFSMLLSKGVGSVLCLLAGLFPFAIINLVYKSFLPAFQGSSAVRFEGFLFSVLSPVTVGYQSIAPAVPLLAILGISVSSLVILRLAFGRIKVRKSPTWNCGFNHATSRMQYTATGYSSPMGVVLKIIFKPSEETRYEKGESPYSPRSISYTLTQRKLFEKTMYNPVVNAFLKVADFLKERVQTGSAGIYLLYIFTFMIILLILNKFATFA